MDFGATHHITNSLEDLHFSTPYHGGDKITVGDGNTLPITHSGMTKVHMKTHTLHLPQVFHVPLISRNLLSVSTLCQTNPISIEFFCDHFLVKDLKTRVPLLKGLHKNGLYHMPLKYFNR